MKPVKIIKLFASGFTLIAATNFLSFAQVTNAIAANTNSLAASPASSGQVPDDAIKKLSKLVHGGKYAEAQQLTSGLLLAYPEDQRLFKAKALLEKALATAVPTNIVPNNIAPVQPVTNPNSEQLTGMDRVEYNSLIELGHEAQQTTDLDQQKTLLHRFMDESKPFLERHPNNLLLWQLRAASALSLDDILAGYEAGQRLLASGQADNDPSIQRLLSQLNLKRWLDKNKAEAEQKLEENKKKFGWLLGTWNVTWDWPIKGFGGGNSRGKEEFRLADSNIEGYEIPNKTVMGASVNGFQILGNEQLQKELWADASENSHGERTNSDLRGSILDSGKIQWRCYLPANDQEGLYVMRYHFHPTVGYPGYHTDGGSTEKLWLPFGWQPVVSCVIGGDKKTMIIVIPCQSADPKSKKPLQNPVTLTFTKENDTQSQKGQPQP